MSMRAVIVDDERLARRALLGLLAEGHPDVEVVAEACNVASAAEALAKHRPELVFLDIQMPGGDGFTLFDQVQVDARVIFVTAYDQFALRAFEVNALDYLVKPISPERLARAIERARAGAASPPAQDVPLTEDDLLCLATPRGLALFRVREITHLTAAGDYSEVHLQDKGPVLADVPLRRWEERLPAGFVRVHRGAVVHVDHVEDIARHGESYEVRLKGGATVAMSRRHAARLQTELGRPLRPPERS
jgi:two-component system LytT family response regulator